MSYDFFEQSDMEDYCDIEIAMIKPGTHGTAPYLQLNCPHEGKARDHSERTKKVPTTPKEKSSR